MPAEADPSGAATIAFLIGSGILYGGYAGIKWLFRYRELWKHLKKDGENPLKMLHEYRAERADRDE